MWGEKRRLLRKDFEEDRDNSRHAGSLREFLLARAVGATQISGAAINGTDYLPVAAPLCKIRMVYSPFRTNVLSWSHTHFMARYDIYHGRLPWVLLR